MYSEIIEELRIAIPNMLQEQHIPGLSIALINRQGPMWMEGFGYTDLDQQTPVTPDTMFSIQSTSKTLTATGIMLAVQKGLLDLDVPVCTYIPEFTVHSRFEEHPEQLITLRHCLSHTAGFTHEAPVGNNLTDAPSFEAHIASISETWLRYPVGQRYSYSNLGIDLAAYILQIVSQKPFSQVMKETLFDPLGMVNSSTSTAVIRQTQNRAIGHSNGARVPRLDIPMLGAGGVYASVADMAGFVQFFLNNGKLDGQQFLAEPLVAEMFTVPFAVPGQKEGYGLGLSVMRQHNTRLLTHSGGGFGFLSDMAWYPELGIGAVVLTNSTSHNLQWKLCNDILDRVISTTIGEIADASPIKELEMIDIDPLWTEQLAGEYIGRWGPLVLKLRDAVLGIQSDEQFRPFVFTSNTDAHTDEGQHYRFMFTADGYPSYIISLNDGGTWDYNGGPSDKPGPNRPEWQQVVGDYAVKLAGRAIAASKIYVENGYLYVSYMNQNLRLDEYQPGLFFTSTGETLDLRDKPVFAGIFGLEKV